MRRVILLVHLLTLFDIYKVSQSPVLIRSGGQHPEWDEELRFTIHEDLDDVLLRSESQSDSLNSSVSSKNVAGDMGQLTPSTTLGALTPAQLASKSRKGPLGKKGGKSMKVACFADDAKEPELIGEVVVPIDEVLKKGEVDGRLHVLGANVGGTGINGHHS